MSAPWASAPLLLSLALLGSACARDTEGNSPSQRAQAQARVGNNDPRGVDDQPDWDAQARELKQRVGPRLPSQLPTDAKATCAAMVDEVLAFYLSIEPDPERRAERSAELEQTRSADIAGCMESSSIEAALCVTTLLKDRDSEFPWLLDQCSRAYPKAGAPVVGVAGDGPAAEPRAAALELTFVGDIIFGRYREDNVFDPIIEPSKAADLAGPFAEIEAELRSDVLVGNLETPVLELLPEKSPIGSKFRFGAGRAEVQLLRDAGFSVLSLANNHYFDLRDEGQLESPRILASEGITAIGVSQTDAPVFRLETHEVKGWRVGLIGVTNRINAPIREGRPQVPYLQAKEMAPTLGPLVERARADHDLIVIVVHWGDEYAEGPSRTQQRAARALIDGGADMVVGHHPHVLQGVERYGAGLIAYSMGNFLFEHTGSVPRLTGVLRTRWLEPSEGRPACLAQTRFHPAYMKRTPYPHPAAATGGIAKQVRKRVVSQAALLNTSFVQVEGSELLELEGLEACAS